MNHVSQTNTNLHFFIETVFITCFYLMFNLHLLYLLSEYCPFQIFFLKIRKLEKLKKKKKMENKACARRCSTNCLNATISQSQNNSRFSQIIQKTTILGKNMSPKKENNAKLDKSGKL